MNQLRLVLGCVLCLPACSTPECPDGFLRDNDGNCLEQVAPDPTTRDSDLDYCDCSIRAFWFNGAYYAGEHSCWLQVSDVTRTPIEMGMDPRGDGSCLDDAWSCSFSVGGTYGDMGGDINVDGTGCNFSDASYDFEVQCCEQSITMNLSCGHGGWDEMEVILTSRPDLPNDHLACEAAQ